MVRDIRIREIMTKPVISVNVEDSFELVEKKLRGKIRHLPVVDDFGGVVGLISQRDLFRTISPHRNVDGEYVYDASMLHDFVLKHQMTKDPFTLSPDDRISKALEVMITSRYGCIPITEEKKKLVGIITTSDVLRWVSSQVGMP